MVELSTAKGKLLIVARSNAPLQVFKVPGK
jgi:hypothetical protein